MKKQKLEKSKQTREEKNKQLKEEKKLLIIQAAVFAFAEKGFHGTLTKNIAKAAGISEGLLYKYFSNKEDIYLSLRNKYIDSKVLSIVDEFKDREPGGKMLIEMVYSWIIMIITDISKKTNEQNALDRLLIYSFVENPEYLEHHFRTFKKELSPLWDKCIKAAKRNKELINNINTKNSMWFVHSTAMATNFINIAGDDVFPYNGKYEDIIKEIIRFTLMGIGLKSEVIAKYYKPEKFHKYMPKN